jgi:hypothetical protein
MKRVFRKSSTSIAIQYFATRKYEPEQTFPLQELKQSRVRVEVPRNNEINLSLQ